MDKWRSRFYGYTGLFTVLAIWTPVIWFISSARDYYRMETFDILRMHWSGIAIFAVLLVATLVAQFGFVSIAHDLSKYEAMKNSEPPDHPFA